MSKYLIEATYTAEGLKGLQRDKAAGRTNALQAALKTIDGQLDCVYWCLGERDVVAIVDVPNMAAIAALSTMASASGLLRTRTTMLMSAEEMDAALEEKVQ